MAADVVVLDYETPRQRLMAWFLSDSGIANVRVATIEDAIAAVATHAPRVLIVNSQADVAEIARVVRLLRHAATTTRIIVLHDGKHTEDGPAIDADLCMHDVRDIDDLVDLVTAAIVDDDLPDEEPHEAAEEVIECA